MSWSSASSVEKMTSDPSREKIGRISLALSEVRAVLLAPFASMIQISPAVVIETSLKTIFDPLGLHSGFLCVLVPDVRTV